VGDVAEAFFKAATNEPPAPGALNARAFNIGTGTDTSVLGLIERLARLAGVQPSIEFRPARAGEIERSLLSVDKVKKFLNWEAKVGLDEGLARTYAWLTAGGTPQ
jgi:UDP-glucose 4-epimerase